MAEYINRNDSRSALAVSLTIRPKSRFWSTYFFGGGTQELPSEKCEWDAVHKGAPLANFVGEDLTVEPTERVPFATHEITTPKYQYRKVLSLHQLRNRLPGENDPFMHKTAQERAGILEAEDDIECVEAIAERQEVMSAQFMTTGIIPIVGLGVNRKIDYHLPNRTALVGGDRWGQVGVDILKSLRGRIYALHELGFYPDEIYMHPDVWEVMINDEKVYKLLDNRRYEMGVLSPEQCVEYGRPVYKGLLTDPYIKIYTQHSMYGAKGERQSHLPPGTMVITSPQARQNKMVYGALTYMEDGVFKTVSGEFIRQTFHSDRSSQKEVIVTSRAVPVPENVESWDVFSVL